MRFNFSISIISFFFTIGCLGGNNFYTNMIARKRESDRTKVLVNLERRITLCPCCLKYSNLNVTDRLPRGVKSGRHAKNGILSQSLGNGSLTQGIGNGSRPQGLRVGRVRIKICKCCSNLVLGKSKKRKNVVCNL